MIVSMTLDLDIKADFDRILLWMFSKVEDGWERGEQQHNYNANMSDAN